MKLFSIITVVFLATNSFNIILLIKIQCIKHILLCWYWTNYHEDSTGLQSNNKHRDWILKINLSILNSLVKIANPPCSTTFSIDISDSWATNSLNNEVISLLTRYMHLISQQKSTVMRTLFWEFLEILLRI